MEITLEPEMRAFIEAAIEAGEFDSASEALNAAVAELRRRNEYRDYVRNAVAESTAARERGEGTVYGADDTSRLAEEIKAEAHARYAALARKVA